MNDKPTPVSEELTDLERLDDLAEHFSNDHQRVRQEVRRIGLCVAEEMAAGNPIYIASDDPGLLYYRYTDDGWKTETQFGNSDFKVFDKRSGTAEWRESAEGWKEISQSWKQKNEWLEPEVSHQRKMVKHERKMAKRDREHYEWMLNHAKESSKSDKRFLLFIGGVFGVAFAILVMAIALLVAPVTEDVGVDRSGSLCYKSVDVDQTLHSKTNYSPPQRLIGHRSMTKKPPEWAAFVVLAPVAQRLSSRDHSVWGRDRRRAR